MVHRLTVCYTRLLTRLLFLSDPGLRQDAVCCQGTDLSRSASAFGARQELFHVRLTVPLVSLIFPKR